MKHSFDIVVVGAGPAGLAAATAVAEAGRRVAVLDENPRVGGQIWRASLSKVARDRSKERAVARFEASGAKLFSGHQIVDGDAAGALESWVAATQSLETFSFERLILATGARERFLPFPGWTLPGVFGAGGLQALVRSGYDIRGKRVVVVGTGPLLLAVAAHLKQDGARVVLVAEQAPLSQLMQFGLSLITRPGKIVQGLSLRAQLANAQYRTGCWPVAALGDGTVTGVRLSDGSRTWTEACDLLACGFHLVPNTELATLLGCEVGDHGVVVDADQQTSVASVYCVGETTAIAGVDAALLQGRIAGLAAAGRASEARTLHMQRDAERSFGRRMDRAFALRKEMLTLAMPDTIVCRCEDVRFSQISQAAAPGNGWTNAKLQTRCGMGPCQGRICGPALNALFGWKNTSVRAPLFPLPIAALCSSPLATDDATTLVTQEN
ncbi:FAD/NAD(P)-dependent oxidoreductase [Granulicella paludicola]|uniref:FAD/NAD(P)-dependent oxidoreductase n=1 Tax=Granulicella paludicola TaxID=474951 RepID=UPI0021E0F183|nr:FAD/NAD(P)-binding oxidoreductase [Granulicella paludicola]